MKNKYLVLYEDGKPISYAHGRGRMIKTALQTGFVEVSKEEFARARRIVQRGAPVTAKGA